MKKVLLASAFVLCGSAFAAGPQYFHTQNNTSVEVNANVNGLEAPGTKTEHNDHSDVPWFLVQSVCSYSQTCSAETMFGTSGGEGGSPLLDSAGNPITMTMNTLDGTITPTYVVGHIGTDKYSITVEGPGSVQIDPTK